MNWRALLDLWPRKLDSLSDAKRSAWKAKPGDGIVAPRPTGPAHQREFIYRPETTTTAEPVYPQIIVAPQVDEYGNWKRH